jgi:large conductance mechanosensitive channel
VTTASVRRAGARRVRTRFSDVWASFKAFLNRGNVLDLAVAVILGLAFNALVQSLVNDVIMRFIAAVFGKPSFEDVSFKVGHGVVLVGRFANTVINFLIVALVLFFIVRLFEQLQRLRYHGQLRPEEEPQPSDEAVLLTQIRDLLADQRGREDPVASEARPDR